MLINLHVKNLALIEETEVDFSDHLNILTGETGAGKSILIGSIQAALGGKIPKDMIRHGEDSALIELIFHTESKAVEAKLEEYDIPWEDGDVIISRRITNQRVINKVNDCTVTVAKLRELSALLMDLSGQHENQLLLRPQNHLKILDDYQKTRIYPVRAEVSECYKEYVNLRRQLKEQSMDEASRVREMEFLEYEIKEIKDARLSVGEDEDIEKQFKLISHAREILDTCGNIHQSTCDDAGGAGYQIGNAMQELSSIMDLDPAIKPLQEQLGTIDALLNDFNRELSGYMSGMEFDPQTYREVEERYDQINHLKAKYGNSVEEILEYLHKSSEKYKKLKNYEEYLQDLEQKRMAAKKRLDSKCRQLRLLRQEASAPLAKAIREALLDLNFNEVQFEIQMDRLDTYTADGFDKVCFMISTNKGMAVKPIQEIASGGELSRIMLAIKSVLADEDQIETLIFDEIDTGISGRTAQKVSERLAMIGSGRQVIAITHLPQIAAMADSHYLIEKTSDSTSTISSIYLLSEEQSVEELARMLGGARITEAVLENAREMRGLAQNYKSQI